MFYDCTKKIRGHEIEGAIALTSVRGKSCGMAVRQLHRARNYEPSKFSKCDSSVEKSSMVEAVDKRWKKREGAAAVGLGSIRL